MFLADIHDLIARTVIAGLWASVAAFMGMAVPKARGIATRSYRILMTFAASSWAIYYTFRIFGQAHPDVWISRSLQGVLIAVFWYHLWLIRMGGGVDCD